MLKTPSSFFVGSNARSNALKGLHARFGYKTDRDEFGTVEWDEAHPIVLLAGRSSSGVSDALSAILYSLLSEYAPETLGIYLSTDREGFITDMIANNGRHFVKNDNNLNTTSEAVKTFINDARAWVKSTFDKAKLVIIDSNKPMDYGADLQELINDCRVYRNTYILICHQGPGLDYGVMQQADRKLMCYCGAALSRAALGSDVASISAGYHGYIWYQSDVGKIDCFAYGEVPHSRLHNNVTLWESKIAGKSKPGDVTITWKNDSRMGGADRVGSSVSFYVPKRRHIYSVTTKRPVLLLEGLTTDDVYQGLLSVYSEEVLPICEGEPLIAPNGAYVLLFRNVGGEEISQLRAKYSTAFIISVYEEGVEAPTCEGVVKVSSKGVITA